MRIVFAHIAAISSGSLILFVGIEMIAFGSVGLLSGPAKWAGGVLIILILAGISIPAGLFVRYLAGKIPVSPRTAAVFTGIVIGMLLLPALHPGFYPSVFWAANPVSLLVVHVIAGAVGGLIWFKVEFKERGFNLV